MTATEDALAIPSQLFDVEGTEKKMKEWEQVKARVLTKDDIVKRDNNTQIKRSGWDKLALAANVTTTIVDIKTEKEADWSPTDTIGDFTATVTMRASASWGRSAENVGAYSASEYVDKNGGRLPISRHNIVARATTRAHNRAVSDLIGGGEVSAEEIEYGAEAHKGDAKAEYRKVVSINVFVDMLGSYISEGLLEITDDPTYIYIKRTKFLNDKEFKEISSLLDSYSPIADMANRRWQIPKA